MRNGFCFLTDKLPTSIGGLPLDTRTCTAVGVLLKLRGDDSEAVKVSYMAMKLFHKSYSEVLEALNLSSVELDTKVIEYLSGAPEVKSWNELHADPSKTGVEPSSDKKRQTIPDFDFVQDSGSIFSAFRQLYHLSLDEVCNLHWWEFLELFRNIPSEGNTFGIKRTIRNRKPDPKATPEQKQALREAKQSVKLKDTRNPEQKAIARQAMFNSLEL